MKLPPGDTCLVIYRCSIVCNRKLDGNMHCWLQTVEAHRHKAATKVKRL